MAHTPSDSGSGNAATLARGKACLRCRKRKMRCDGAKPACSQCTRAHKPEACQYDDGKGKTRTQALREKIARLEEEIALLRDPDYSTTPSIMLHDPHASQSNSASPTSMSAQFGHSDRHSHNTGHGHDSGGSSASSSPVGSPSTGSAGLSGAASPYHGFDSIISPRTPFAPLRTMSPVVVLANDDIPIEFTHALYDEPSKSPMSAHLPSSLSLDSRLDIFLLHRRQCGFALHVERLRASLSLSTAGQGHPQQFQYAGHQTQHQRHPVLANAIYLWASFLSRSTQLGAHEQYYLQRTQHALVDALNISQYQSQQQHGQSGLSPPMTASPGPATLVTPATVVIDAIQASVLLARYFFATARLHEASYHASAAADLAVQVGLHQINSSVVLAMAAQQQWGNYAGPSVGSSSALHLPAPQDSVELGERIGVFWQVYILDRLLSVALRRPPCIIDDDCVETRIDTPWPEDITEYENIRMETIHGDSTLRTFFLSHGQHASTHGGFSPLALHVKAAALYSAAARASANWGLRPSAQSQVSSPPSNPVQEFHALEATVNRFLATLVPAHQLGAGQPDEDRRGYLAIHTLMHAALVQLHLRFAREGNMQSLEKCVRAARGAAQISRHFTDADYEYLDPVFGPCWTSIASVFSLEQVQATATWTPQGENRTQQDLTLLLSALARMGARFPIMGYQLSVL